MPEKVEILNIKINRVNMQEAEKIVCEFIDADLSGKIVVTPNSEMVVRAQTDRELAEILNDADLAIPDGAGIVLASHILPTKIITERVAGFDLMGRLFSVATNRDYSIYLLGGEPGIVHRAKKKITSQHPDINICGLHHGYLDRRKQREVISEINSCAPDLLLVGMGVPLQEKFLHNNIHKLNIGVGMTVGGSFDVWAGKSQRAPVWMQKAYLEWFYRLLKEPSRLSRMIALPRFVVLVFFAALRRWGGFSENEADNK
ncbi:MAG: WecB/TagA/CpsF family glycosyltransferase [Halanaerobiaceae bacterium]